MRVHHYDENGEYRATTIALESPLEPGVFLVPNNATTLAPPEDIPGMACVFRDGQWTHVLDKRRTVYWLSHDDRRVIKEIGEDLPECAMLEQPPAPPQPVIRATEVDAIQFRMALDRHGMLADTEAWVSTQPTLFQQAWNTTPRYRIDAKIMQYSAQQLNVSAEQLQDLFDEAALIDINDADLSAFGIEEVQ